MEWIRRHSLVILCICLTAVFAISLLPILAASFYAHPAHDDYGYSANVHHVLESGAAGVGGVLSAAFDTVKEYYFYWQGSFAAMFLMTLQPAVFGEQWYFLTTFVMLFSLCFGTLFLFHVLAARVFRVKPAYAYVCASVCLIFSVQLMPSAYQGLYWWNGSVYYTFFYGVSMVLYAFIGMLLFPKSRKGAVCSAAAACGLSVLVGGSNYTTVLLSLEIMFLCALYAYFFKRQSFPHALLVFLCLLGAFAVSALAPGNRVRAQELTGMSPLKACVYAVVYGGYYILKWTGPMQLAYLVLLTPLVYSVARTRAFGFPYPIAVLFFCLLLFSSQFTPPLFAMSTVGAERQWNIYYYAYYPLITFCWIYLVGWAVKREKTEKLVRNIVSRRKTLVAVAAVLIATGLAFRGVSNLTSVITAKGILSGEAREYDKRYRHMLTEISAAESRCEIDGINTAPEFLSPISLSENADFWVNNQMEHYFGLEEIRRRQ